MPGQDQSQQPNEQVSPELAAAYHKLYDTYWNKCGTVESDLPGYSMLTNAEVNALDDAAGAIEDLLCRDLNPGGQG